MTQPINHPIHIVIVGGVAGGASAAARARRLSETARITIFERGEHISFANCGLPYHIAGTISDRGKLLVQTPEAMRRRFGIDVRTQTEVLAIDPAARTVRVRSRVDGAEQSVSYDYLVLSPGAEPVRPPIPGADHPLVRTLRNMADMDAIKAIIDEHRPERAIVVGGGYIGLEMTEALVQRGVSVSLLVRGPQLMGHADPEMTEPLNAELLRHRVDLRLGTSLQQLTPEPQGLRAFLSDGSEIKAGLVILATGVRPEATLAREAGLAIGERGGISVDEAMRTSDPRIFAVGDAVEVIDYVGGQPALIPLAGPANRQGRIAADNIFGRDSRYDRTQGTAICKVFDLAIGMTGQSEKALRRAGRACEKIYVHPASHAGYYPGAHPLSLKLLFDPADGRILGAQAVGADGIDKRIDVLAVAIRAGMTVFDLEELELAYAPPYGSARDPINQAGFAAANVLRGDVSLAHADQLDTLSDQELLLDVRSPAECTGGMIPGSINIPLDQLRDRLEEIPRDRELIVSCQVGLRGYLACRILSQHGFACRNLSGGYKTWLQTRPFTLAGPA